MLDLRSIEFLSLLNNYSNKVAEVLIEPEFSTEAEGKVHTNYLTRCSRGDSTARDYVKNLINKALEEKISNNDKGKLKNIVDEEIDNFKNSRYKIFELGINANVEMKLSYYQLCELSANKKQRKYLENLKNGNVDSYIDFLGHEIYKKLYGADVVDDILQMEINNLEVHDVYKLRVELANGNWYTIDDFNFSESETVKSIARRLLSQDSGSDLTEENCERESMLIDGSRITVALKPAADINYFFIKKFDAFTVSEEEMIKNGTLSIEMVKDLKILAKGRSNSVIIGGVNTGKSTFLKVLVGFFPKHFKIGVVDSSKDTNLRILYPERDVITLYETLKYSLKDQFSRLLRANRNILIITEARSFEVEEMIKAMTRGNDGSLSTLHTTTVAMTINNIAYMCQENGIPQDMRVLRSRVSEALDTVYRVRHLENGNRLVDEVTEVVATDDLDRPFKTAKMWYWDNNEKIVKRNAEYKVSEALENKLRYYGCTDEDINFLNRGAV